MPSQGELQCFIEDSLRSVPPPREVVVTPDYEVADLIRGDSDQLASEFAALLRQPPPGEFFRVPANYPTLQRYVKTVTLNRGDPSIIVAFWGRPE